MLTGKQKRYLRSLAMKSHATMQIGKSGITEAFIEQFMAELNKNELIKISLLQNTDAEPDEVITAITAQSKKVELVQKIGRNLVFFKQASEVKNRELSNEVFKLR